MPVDPDEWCVNHDCHRDDCPSPDGAGVLEKDPSRESES